MLLSGGQSQGFQPLSYASASGNTFLGGDEPSQNTSMAQESSVGLRTACSVFVKGPCTELVVSEEEEGQLLFSSPRTAAWETAVTFQQKMVTTMVATE